MMKIKKFTAPTIPGALKLAERELGKDALILGASRSPARDGEGSRVEVVAATGGERAVASAQAGSPRAGTRQIDEVRKMDKSIVMELKQIERRLGQIIRALPVEIEDRPGRALGPVPDDRAPMGLLNAGFDPLLVGQRLASGTTVGGKSVDQLVRDLVNQVGIEQSGEEVSAFLGPSGSGKTTTLLKIAKSVLLPRGTKPHIFYFGKADERGALWLKQQSKLLGLRFKAVDRPGHLEKAIARRGKAPIFIDTPSISDFSDSKLRFLIDLSKRVDCVRIRLVIDSTMDPMNICSIASCIPETPRIGLVLTKLDEANRIGGAVSAAITTGIPIAYVTGGRGVGDGIFVPDADLIWDKVLDAVKETGAR
jgi:flagellar biosynthesis protein FlhF